MGGTTRVVIIHGAYGGPNENWFPWLSDQVKKLGHEAVVPSLPTPEGQTLGSWTRVFMEQCGALTADTVLVGHSLAAGFILALLETSPVRVKGTFVASGFLGNLGLADFDSINESFVCREFKWDTIRKNAGEVHVYNSDTDPYVPLEKGYELARNLGVTLAVVNNGGHINTSAGFTAFPMLFDDLRALLARA